MSETRSPVHTLGVHPGFRALNLLPLPDQESLGPCASSCPSKNSPKSCPDCNWAYDDPGDALMKLMFEKLRAEYLPPCLNQKWLPKYFLLLHTTFIRWQIVHFCLLWGRKGYFVGLLLKGNKRHSCSQKLHVWEMRSLSMRVICWYNTFV